MKFSEIVYERPDIDQIKLDFNDLVDSLERADTIDLSMKLIQEVDSLKKSFRTLYSFIKISHSIDTRDPFFDGENSFLLKSSPEISAIENRYYKAVLDSKFYDQLLEKLGQQYFDLANCFFKTQNEAVLEDIKKENELASGYSKLIASAEVLYKGKTYNLAGLAPLKSDLNEVKRKEAHDAYWSFFKKNQEEIETIFDDLVKIRTTIAQKLGFENFVQLGYFRLGRASYDAQDVTSYRSEVLKEVVPIVNDLAERKRQRIQVDKMTYYNESLKFLNGNPTPKGGHDWIVKEGKKMYEELSSETGEFFNYMLDNELMDLDNKDGKQVGGYCSFLPDLGHPYIFSNFNGTSHDIDVLTHEAGHAFQIYSSKNQFPSEYFWPTLEAAEIHSMSMEFLTWPWMKNFFKEEEEKYKFDHLSSSLSFIPYGVVIDEFQHFVYENPSVSKQERNDAYIRIEKKYRPWMDYSGNEQLAQGVFWQKQAHLFKVPFYYIDYTLAQVCAFQFWSKSRKDFESTWEDYKSLCNKGGSLSFVELVKSAHLLNPFHPGNLKEVCQEIKAYIDQINDKEL